MAKIDTLIENGPAECYKMIQNETFSADLPERTRARYESLAGLLLLGGDLAGVCQYGHISRASLHRLMRKPEFKAVLRELRGHTLEAVRANLATVAGEALDLLSKVIRDESAPMGHRVRAAIAVLQSVVTDEDSPRPPVPHQHLHAHIVRKDGNHE